MVEFNPYIQALIEYVLPSFATALATLLTVAAGLLVKSLNERHNNNKVQSALELAEKTMLEIILSLEQTVVQEFIKKSQDGKLTEEEKVVLKTLALETMKEVLKPNVKEALSQIYQNLDAYFEFLLESQLKIVKDEFPREG